MGRAFTPRHTVPVVPLVGMAIIVLLITGCDRHLVFAERTGFQLAAVNVGQDIDRPFSVNMGLERRIIAFAPPTEGFVRDKKGRKHAQGDSASLLSGFEMNYKRPTNVFNSEVSISTQFASGMAARRAAEIPELGTAIMGAQSNKAWFRVPGEASLADLEAHINNAERARGHLVKIEVDGEKTVFEIASGTSPGSPITLQTGDVQPAAGQTSVTSGEALIAGTPTPVTALRATAPTTSESGSEQTD